ncbi:MAG: Nramp family divalent metal transporter [candidate division WOR-3 bacterium]|nr:Nramp family divalent metal transporter [candidate division WOR-3 bacterium]
MIENKIGCLPINTKPEVPPPPSKKEFMLWIGPVMMTVALGLGTSEVILYPHLTSRFGVGWLGLMVLTLFLQTVWAKELARWTVVSGEHAVQGNARILSFPGATISISLFMFLAFMLPAWATSAASALREILNWPVDARTGTVFWAYVTFIIVFLVVFLSQIARKYIEHIATWTTVLAWVILIFAAFMAIKSETIGHMFYSLFIWRVPRDMDWWVLGSTIAWVGAGPTLIWYTYWMRDAGWGMAGYIDAIPGWFGKSANPVSTGYIPEKNGENISRLKVWIKRSNLVLWIGYFLGSLITIFIFVGLSDSILRPAGLVPKGFDVVKHQAQFFAIPLGKIGVFLFLFVAWLLFFNTQLTTAEALVRQNADITWNISERLRKAYKNDIKGVYFLWWLIYLVISFVLIGVQYFVKGANPFAYVTIAAMLSFISLIFSMIATFIGSILLYRNEIITKVKPNIIWTIILGISTLIHAYIIIRAVGYFFGFWK